MKKTNIKQSRDSVFSVLAVVGTLTVGALFTLPNAEASQPVPATFSSTDCEHIISQEPRGPNTIITLSITACLHGTFEGTWVGTERDVIHPNGTFATGQGSGVFSGIVNGRSGTCVFSYVVNVGVANPTHWVADQGTGDLAGLSGQGTQQFVSEDGPGCPTSGFDCVDCPPPTGTCDDSFTLNNVGQIQFAP
jgi:hypothetical protein